MDRLYAFLADLAARGLLPDPLRYPFVARGVLAVLLLAPLLGGMSHLVVARRLAFFSTALGQAALTGLTLGLLAGEPIQAPYAGVFGFCLLSALGMVYVKRRSRLPPDTLIGVFMALTLGLGICLLVAATKQFNIHQIEAVMFGSLLTVTDTDLLVLLVVVLGVLGVLGRRYNDLLLDSTSPPLARVAGVDAARVEYLFVVLLTMAIVVSLKIIGALLVEALVVVPAAAARNLARSMRSYLAWSVGSALVTGLAGIWVSTRFRVPTGGAVVLALALCFFATLAFSGRDRGAPPS
jgi:zinc transport system permease protein